MTVASPAQANNRRNLLILFFTLVVVMMGFGMAIPVLPFFIDSFGAGGSAMGLLMAIYAVAQFLFAPVWGSLSDRYGRKPIIIIGVLGNALSQLFFGLSSALWMLFVARAMAGILSSAALPTAMAYVSDSTTEENRGGGMGIIGAAMGIGMVIGPGAAGLLAAESLAVPFFVAAALSTLALLLIVLFLPESLPPEKRDTSGGLHGPQFGEMARALVSPIGVPLVMAFLLSFGVTNFESVFGLYALARYRYGPEQVGAILMFIGVISAVMQGALTGPLTRRWGDVNVLRGALFISAVGFGLMLMAETLPGILATTGFFVVGNALLRPTVATLISKRTPVGQGTAMGLNNAFMSIGRMVGPMWAGFVFDVQIGLPYLSGAVIMVVGLLVSLIWLNGQAVRSGEAPAEPVRREPTHKEIVS